MKIKIALLFIIVFCKVSFSQNKEWATYDVDSIVAVDMPFEVFEMDTITGNHKIYEMYSGNDSLEFIVRKMQLDWVQPTIETIQLPHNKENLDKFYSDFIWLVTEPFEVNFNSSKAVFKNNLKGFTLRFNDDEGTPVTEAAVFLVGKSFYVFSYKNIYGIREDERNLFFNSIIFNEEIELKQYHKKPSLLNNKVIIGLLLFLILSFLFRFRSKRKKA